MRYGITTKIIGVTVAVMLTGWLGSASIGHATTIDFTSITPIPPDGLFDSLTFGDGTPSKLTLTPKSFVQETFNIDDDPLSNPLNSLGPFGNGSPDQDNDNRGKLFVGDLGKMDPDDTKSPPKFGLGVKNFKGGKVGGSKALSGSMAHDDELVIFSFPNSSAIANTISVNLIGLNDLNCLILGVDPFCSSDDDDVISLLIEFSDLSKQVITSLEIATAIGLGVNGEGILNFSSLGSLDGTSSVKRFAIRAPQGHMGLAGITFDVNPIPEPSSMLLFGTGLAGLAFFRRKNKKRV